MQELNGVLQQLVNGSPFGILVVDGHGLLRMLNTAAKRMVTTIGKPLGRPFTEAIPIPELHSLVPAHGDVDVLVSEFCYGNSVLKEPAVDITSVATRSIPVAEP